MEKRDFAWGAARKARELWREARRFRDMSRHAGDAAALQPVVRNSASPGRTRRAEKLLGRRLGREWAGLHLAAPASA